MLSKEVFFYAATNNITIFTRNYVVSLFPCLHVNRPYMFIYPIYFKGLHFLNIYQMKQKGSKVLCYNILISLLWAKGTYVQTGPAQ